MTLLEAIFLGFLQGVTEFLPVSSSGHLVISEHLLGVKQANSVFFEVVVHFGTLCAIIAVYYQEIAKLLAFVFVPSNRKQLSLEESKNTANLLLLIVLATIPTALIGIFFRDTFKTLFDVPIAVGIALLITGSLLLCTTFAKPKEKNFSNVKWYKGIGVGLMQGISITPGISRSGSTIAIGMFLGIDRTTAANFSFLMAVPAILGAMVTQIKNISEIGSIGIINAASGFVASFIFGYVSLKLLLKIVRKGKLHYFAYYCFALGILTLIYFGL